MHRLLYISTARTPLTTGELDDLLRISRWNNAAAGITGLLVVGGRRFLQALEGPPSAVRDTYDRIRRDPRHFAAVTLADEAIRERAFEEWSMGFQAGADVPPTGLISRDVAKLVAPIGEANLRSYFTGFIERYAAA